MLLIAKNRSGSVAHAVLLTGLLWCWGCDVAAPPRPAGVPADAVWAGGRDGGCFVKCDVDPVRNVNNCTAYLESTGDVLQRGEYQVQGETRAATNKELAYTWCDGEVIGLKNGLVLELVRDYRNRPTS
jgi:hypothetical protein